MGKIKNVIYILLVGFLTGCASSDLSRKTAGDIDAVYYSPRAKFGRSLPYAYQNTSQTTKGVIIGGVTGGAVGAFSSGVGVVPGVAEGAILGGALGAYIDAHTSLLDQLENRRVKVIVLGDQVLIVMSSYRTFYGMTANILPDAYSTLNLVAKFIRGYTKMLVKVAAYTNAACPPVIYCSLSQQQADNVAKYLWRRGVEARLLYAAGMGGSNPIARTSPEWDEGANYRVEITLEKLPT